MLNNNIIRQRIEIHQSKLSEEREWWDRKKATIQEGFMKELDEEGSSASKTESTPAAAPATSATAGASAGSGAGSTSGVKTPESSAAPSATGSDDEPVLVEAEGQSGNAGTPGGSAGGGGGGGKKKKKGKK